MSMRFLFPFVLALASMSAGEGFAQAEETPGTVPATPETLLFADFQKFCSNTGADVDAVKAAAEAANAQLLGHDTKSQPFPMTATTWGHLVNGQRIVISAGTFHMPSDGRNPAVDAMQCTVMSQASYDGVLALAGKWLGISPTDAKPDSAIFDYRVSGAVRTHLVQRDEAAYRAALAEGALWSLVVDVTPDRAAEISLTHPRQAPNPSKP